MIRKYIKRCRRLLVVLLPVVCLSILCWSNRFRALSVIISCRRLSLVVVGEFMGATIRFRVRMTIGVNVRRCVILFRSMKNRPVRPLFPILIIKDDLYALSSDCPP